MPRYHFNFDEEQSHPDINGTELPNIRAARAQAVRMSGAILLHDPEAFSDDRALKLTVTDDDGGVAFTLSVNAA